MKKIKFLKLVIFIYFILGNDSICQTIDFEKSEHIQGGSNNGTEFWFSPIPYWKEYDYFLKGKKTGIYRLFIQTKTEANVRLEIKNKSYKTEIIVDKFNPGIIQLSDTLAQVVLSYHFIDSVDYLHDFNIPSQTFQDGAVHITSDNEISVFVFMYFKYESNAYSLIPAENLGTEYILSSYNAIPIGMSGGYFPSISTITGTHDSTIVKIKIGGNEKTSIILKDNTRYLTKDSLNILLNTGDVFYMQCDNKDTAQDLSGTIVTSNYPVGIVSGVMCAQIPKRTMSCNCISEMSTATRYWGKKFLIPAFINRKLYGFIRIYSKKPNTYIYRNGILFDSVSFDVNNPATSYIERRIYPAFDSIQKTYIPNSNTIISSNNDISITYLNPGFDDERGIFSQIDPDTDPFKLDLVPEEQFTHNSNILLPTVKDTSIMKENYADIIFLTKENLKIPDDIIITKYENKQEVKIFLKDYYTGKIDSFPLVSGNKKYNRISIKVDSLNYFLLSSDSSSFVAYCYGYDVQDSYAFIAGRNFLDSLPVNDTIPPMISGEINCNGYIEGYFYEKDINPDSKISIVVLDTLKSKNYKLKYSPEGLITDSVFFQLEVINPSKDAYAEVHVSDLSGNDTTFYFSYVGFEERERVIYPNPSNDKIINIKIFTCEKDIATIEIWDYIGRKFRTFDNIQLTKGLNTITLNLPELSQSAYFMIIKRPSPRSIHKFIFVN